MPTIPAFTPCPGGFITVQTLDDGRLVIESWWLNPEPFDFPQPCSQVVGHWITSDPAEATKTVAEFVADITRLNRKDA